MENHQPTISQQVRAAPDAKSVKAILASYGNYTSPSVVMSAETLTDDVSIATVMTFAPSSALSTKVKVPIEEFVRRLVEDIPRQSLATMKQSPTLLAPVARDEIGVFVPKITNATIKRGAMMEELGLEDPPAPFATTRSIRSILHIGGSLNGGYAKFHKFLGMPILLDGRQACLFEHAARDAQFRDALKASGWPENAVDELPDAWAKVNRGPSADPIHELMKVIYFPIGGDAYRQVTPTFPTMPHLEISRRLRALRQLPEQADRRFMPANGKREMAVGGPQPQNASTHISWLGGTLTMLTSMPPARIDAPPLERLARTLKVAGTVIPTTLQARIGTALLASLADPRSNRESRERYARRLAIAAGTMLAPSLALHEATLAGETFDPKAFKDPVEAVLVIYGPAAVSKEGVDSLIERLGLLLADLSLELAHLAGADSYGDLHRAVMAGLDGDFDLADLFGESVDQPDAPEEETATGENEENA